MKRRKNARHHTERLCFFVSFLVACFKEHQKLLSSHSWKKRGERVCVCVCVCTCACVYEREIEEVHACIGNKDMCNSCVYVRVGDCIFVRACVCVRVCR